jgi:hypothetical protein
LLGSFEENESENENEKEKEINRKENIKTSQNYNPYD